ncbi:TPA: hypothetical protein ACN98P_002302 [Vibrio parahaemolyticus]
MKQKTILNVPVFSKACYQQNADKNQTQSIEASSKLRLQQLRNMFNSLEDKDRFSQQLLAVAKQAVSKNAMPTLDSIPITDIALYSYKRRTSQSASRAFNDALSIMASHKEFTTIPSFISATISPDGVRHLPSFGEMVIQASLINHDPYLDRRGLSADSTIDKKPMFASDLLSNVMEGLRELNVEFKNNFHLARAFMREVDYLPSAISSFKAKDQSTGFSEQTIAQAVIYALSNDTFEMSSRQLARAIEVAYLNNVDLNSIVVCGTESLEDTVDLIDDETVRKDHSLYSKKQIVDDITEKNAHKLDESYDPMSHFDL